MIPHSFDGLPEIIIRSSVVYLVIIIGFRLAGKRHISQLSLIDFALVLLVSNAVQNAMVGNDSSLLGGIVAATTLIVINVVLTKVIFKNEGFARFFEGEPRLLVRNGKYVTSNLLKEDIRIEELEEQIREHGVNDVSQVKTAILEIDGSISVIPMENDVKNIERTRPFYRRRHRGRRGIGPN